MILRILAIVAAVAAGALFFMAKGKLAEQQTAVQKAEQATQAVQAELATANEQITALEGRLSSEREALAGEKRKLESVRSEMYTARQEVSRTQQQLREARQSIEDLENTAKRLRADLLQSEQSLAAASKEGEIAQLNERIAELEKANAELKETVEDLKARGATAETTGATGTTGSITTGGAYSSTYTSSVSQPLPKASLGAKTTIQTVSAENGLIVLANSPELGMVPGLEVKVIKDLKALGSIQIVEVRPDLVIANILPGANTRAMKAGSEVSLLR
jgi:multidrug efflux pump subunit AcrA (membrane-fusion protein)